MGGLNRREDRWVKGLCLWKMRTIVGQKFVSWKSKVGLDGQCKFTLELDPRLAAQQIAAQKPTTKNRGILDQVHGFFSSSKGGGGALAGGGSAASATDGVSQSEAVPAADSGLRRRPNAVRHQGQASVQERPDADHDTQALLPDSEPKDTKCNIC